MTVDGQLDIRVGRDPLQLFMIRIVETLQDGLDDFIRWKVPKDRMPQVGQLFNHAVRILFSIPIRRTVEINKRATGIEIQIMENQIRAYSANLTREVVDIFSHAFSSSQ